MKRKRRWFRWIVLCVFALLLLAVVAVQIVLWTDLPRLIVVSQLRQATGMEVQIDEFTTDWLGRTHVKGFRLRLPDHDEPYLIIESARISHSGLLTMAITQSLSVENIRADGIQLTVEQNPLREWNFEEVFRLVSAAGGDQVGGAAPNPLADLQQVELTHIQVQVTDSDGRSSQVKDAHISASSLGLAALRFQLQAGEKEIGSGQFVMSGGMSHQLSIDLAQAVKWAGDWRSELPETISGQCIWRGTVIDGLLRGRLQLVDVEAGEYRADGLVALTMDNDDGLRLTPLGLRVTVEPGSGEIIVIHDGTLQWKDGTFSCTRLALSGYDVNTQISGSYDIASQKGSLSVDWSSREGSNSLHRGSLAGTIDQSFHGLQADFKLNGVGAIGGLAWDGRMSVNAKGASWDRLDWELRATEGHVSSIEPGTDGVRRHVPLAGLLAKGRVDWPMVFIDQSEHEFDGRFAANGWLSADTKKWHLNLQGDRVDPFRLIGQSLDVHLIIDGEPDVINLTSANVSGPQISAQANGRYRLREVENPLKLTIAASAWHGVTQEPNGTDDPPLEPAAGGGDQEDESLILQEAGRSESTDADAVTYAGAVRFNGELMGSLDDLRLDLRGQIDADRLQAQGKSLDAVVFKLRSSLEKGVLKWDSDTFEMLGGSVKVAGEWKLAQRNLHIRAVMKEILFSRWIPLVDPELSVAGRGELDLHAAIPLDDINRVVVDGSFSVDHFVFGDARFDRMTGKLGTRKRGVLELNPIRIHQTDGSMNGRLVLNLINGYQASGSLKCQHWTIQVPGQDASAQLSGRIDLEQADLRTGKSRGAFEIDAQLLAAAQDVGTAKLRGTWDREQVQVRMAKSSILGGTVEGEVTVELLDLMQSRGELSWSGIAPGRFKSWAPTADDIKGATRGSLKFGPSKSAKAFEPLRFDLSIEAEEKLVYRNLSLGPVKATIYGGSRRWVLDGFDLKIAGGSIRLWAAATKHDEEWRDHVHIDLDKLDLNQLARVWEGDPAAPGDDSSGQVPGEISASLDFYGGIGDWTGHTGGGRIRLAKSNLQNTDVFGAILSGIGIKQNEPTGSGFVDLRLEKGGVIVDRFIYRNGSTEILFTGRINDLGKGVDTPIQGEAIASLRPLRDLNIGALEDVDRLLRAFQSNVSAFKVEGTLTDGKVSQSRVADVEAWIERFLGKQ